MSDIPNPNVTIVFASGGKVSIDPEMIRKATPFLVRVKHNLYIITLQYIRDEI